LFRRRAIAQFVGDEMDDGLGVGLARKDMALRRQFGAQFAEIFDDPIMNHGDAVVGVRVGVVLGGAAMRRPARVADADGPRERRRCELFFEILELAARPHTGKPTVLQSGDPGRIIAPIFETPQRFDDLPGDRTCFDDSHNAAHDDLRTHHSKSAAKANEGKK